MTENELRDRRRQRANAIRVKAAPIHMPHKEFDRIYKARTVFVGRFQDQTEYTTQMLICDACRSVYAPPDLMEGTYLYVRIEDDPLGQLLEARIR